MSDQPSRQTTNVHVFSKVNSSTNTDKSSGKPTFVDVVVALSKVSPMSKRPLSRVAQLYM